MATTNIIKRGALAFSLILGMFLIFSITSCERRVTPNKVERIISKDSWMITHFYFEGQNIESAYTGQMLGFGDESGSLTVLPYTGIEGHWHVSTGKKPTLLNIYAFTDSLYFNLNDDWTVNSCSNSTIRLESESGSYLNSLTLTKIEN